jgi:polyadenylate-binding protein
VTVEIFKPKKERVDGESGEFNNVYCKNIAEEATEEQVKELFAKHGEVTSMKLNVGYAFINYENPEHAAAACEVVP